MNLDYQRPIEQNSNRQRWNLAIGIAGIVWGIVWSPLTQQWHSIHFTLFWLVLGCCINNVWLVDRLMFLPALFAAAGLAWMIRRRKPDRAVRAIWFAAIGVNLISAFWHIMRGFV